MKKAMAHMTICYPTDSELAAYSFHSSNVLPRTCMNELAVVPIRNVKHWSGQEPSDEGKFTESQVFS